MESRMRRGFTILELLVVIGVIGILMALLLPAVLYSRESARRIECTSRMAQLGKAIHSFESSFQTLPPCGLGPNGDSSAHVYLLPWLEQAQIFQKLSPSLGLELSGRSFDFQRSGSGSKNLRFVSIPVFRCPSDSGQGLNNYAYCVGSSVTWRRTESSRGTNVLGAFAQFNPPNRLSNITDGLSSTAAASERLTGSGAIDSFDGARDTYFSGLELLIGEDAYDADTLANVCQNAVPVSGEFTAFDNATWAFPTYEGAWYNHVFGPNSGVPNCSTMDSRSPSVSATMTSRGIFPARSLHSGSVNLLLLDGSVRTVSNAVDLSIWRGVGTCQDGSVVGEF